MAAAILVLAELQGLAAARAAAARFFHTELVAVA
jgi:hypothetical protein